MLCDALEERDRWLWGWLDILDRLLGRSSYVFDTLSIVDVKPKRSAIRKRIKIEDALLNARTEWFILPNGIMIAAFSLAHNTPYLGDLVMIFGFLTSIVWFVCLRQSWKVIKALTISLHNPSLKPVEKIVQHALGKPGLWRPTDLVARVLPGMFIVFWICVAIFSGIGLFSDL